MGLPFELKTPEWLAGFWERCGFGSQQGLLQVTADPATNSGWERNSLQGRGWLAGSQMMVGGPWGLWSKEGLGA